MGHSRSTIDHSTPSLDGPIRFTHRPTRLYTELIEMVIDHLFDDKATLASCTIVARSWLEPARYHLFSPVRIFYLEFDDFRQFLVSTPHCAKYVQELILSNTYNESICWGPASIDSDHLAALLSSLPNLSYLHISCISLHGDENAFENLPPMKKMHSFKFVGGSLESITPLIHLLRSFPHLRNISLNYNSDEHFDPEHTSWALHHVDFPVLPLESLQLQSCTTIILELVRLLSLGQTALTSIDVNCWSQAQFNTIRSLIQDHHSQLSELMLELTPLRLEGKS